MPLVDPLACAASGLRPTKVAAAVLVEKHGPLRAVPQRDKAMPPVEAVESIAAPKGHEPLTLGLFPCKPSAFVGAAKGAMIRFMDPS
jgi:hypothetical protein